MLKDILYEFGRFICHQIPERSLAPDGMVLPVCARCTGLYAGILISAIVLVILQTCLPKRKQAPANIGLVLFCVSGVPILAADVAAPFFGFSYGTSFIRLITGLAAGYSFPVFLSFTNSGSFVSVKELLIIISALSASVPVIYNGFLGFYALSLAVFAGFFVLWGWTVYSVCLLFRSS